MQSSGWSTAARTAGRFCAVYAGLYCLTTPQVLLALVGGGLGKRQNVADAWSRVWEVAPARNWVAKNVFHTTLGRRFDGGDDRSAWVGQFCMLAAATAAAPIWTALERHRGTEVLSHPWFTLAVRMCLAGQMFYYGAAKAVPLQFQLPLSKLVEPFGQFSPMNVLWSQSAYSTLYQSLLGCAEIAAGLLLVVPRTATLGALLAAAEMAQVLLLNLTFDIPVKIHLSHLLVLGLVLLAPESARLAKTFLLNQPVAPSSASELFGSRRANQVAAAAQVATGLWLLGEQLRNDWAFWKKYGGGREKPALYGIWDVDEFCVDGQPHPPLTTDEQRWRRIIVDSADVVTIQRMDDSLDAYAATIDMAGGSITLSKITDTQRTMTLSLQRPGDDLLTLEGMVDSREVRVRLRRLDLTRFPLVGRGFKWVQESAYWQ